MKIRAEFALDRKRFTIGGHRVRQLRLLRLRFRDASRGGIVVASPATPTAGAISVAGLARAADTAGATAAPLAIANSASSKSSTRKGD